MRTIKYLADEATKKAAADALACQNASNGSGVRNAWNRHVEAMKDSKVVSEHGEHTLDTDAKNGHPVAILFLDKLCSLARIQDFGNDRICKAYDAVEKLANGEDVEWEVG